MKLRRWQISDLSRIAELEKECFPCEPWSFQMLASSFSSDSFYGIVAEDGEIVGYGGMTVAADSADIENIAVTTYFRNSGIATSVLNELMRVAKEKGVKKMFLEVRVSNVAAMKLYLKNGFRGVYARTRYYSDGEDCLVMMRDLDWR